MDVLNSLVFDRSPTPMWVKDYSAVKKQLEQWRQEGVTNLRDFFAANPLRAEACAEKVKVLRVNRKTLDLFGAKDFEEFTQSIDELIIGDFRDIYHDLLIQMWEKGEFFVMSVLNRRLSGEYFYLQVRGYVLPDAEKDWSQVLISTEDITPYKKAIQREEESRKLAESLFNHSPAALLMENFTPIKNELDQLRNQGIQDLKVYLDENPVFIRKCLSLLQVLDANQSAIDLFIAPDKQYLIDHYQETLQHESMPDVMRYNLLQMWSGDISTRQESTFIDFQGQLHHIYLQLTVLPTHEHDWARVQVALTDVTAMKLAEQNLKYLSEHDTLTDLYNRAFYAQELNRLEQGSTLSALSCIFIDINGLKQVNDQEGHEAGDQLIIQAANILKSVTKDTAFTVSRIGGDEFVILMPEINDVEIVTYIEQIHTFMANHNQLAKTNLSFSMGYTSKREGESIKSMLHRADQLMYKDKHAYYSKHERRQLSQI